jgi:hypothetical protein
MQEMRRKRKLLQKKIVQEREIAAGKIDREKKIAAKKIVREREKSEKYFEKLQQEKKQRAMVVSGIQKKLFTA